MSDDAITPNAVLLKELEQCWLHYRHLEGNNLKYMGFFVTIHVASSGFLLTMAKESGVAVGVLSCVATFMFIVFLGSLVLVNNILENGHVLQAYEMTMDEMRAYFYADVPKMLTMMNVRGALSDILNRATRPTLNGNQKFMLALTACLIPGQLIVTHMIVFQAGLVAWTSAASGFYVAGMVAMLGWTIWTRIMDGGQRKAESATDFDLTPPAASAPPPLHRTGDP